MPDLLVEARRVAATVLAGWHGRRISGRGETFWQFRPFVTGEPARHDRLAALGPRRSSLRPREGMGGRAHGLAVGRPVAVDGFPLAAGAGHQARPRHGADCWRWPNCSPPPASASACSAPATRSWRGTPPSGSPTSCPRAAERRRRPTPGRSRRFTDVVLIGDFLDPIAEIEATLDAIVRAGARAHLVQVLDPIEETFPYAGRTEFHDPETGAPPRRRRAPSSTATTTSARLAALRERLTHALPPARLDVPRSTAPTGRRPSRCWRCTRASPTARAARRRFACGTRRMSAPSPSPTPAMLVALVALPVIWYFLRLMPPKPRLEQLPADAAAARDRARRRSSRRAARGG